MVLEKALWCCIVAALQVALLSSSAWAVPERATSSASNKAHVAPQSYMINLPVLSSIANITGDQALLPHVLHLIHGLRETWRDDAARDGSRQRAAYVLRHSRCDEASVSLLRPQEAACMLCAGCCHGPRLLAVLSLRNRRSLASADDVMEVENKVILFISHQWTTAGFPDSKGEHAGLLKKWAG